MLDCPRMSHRVHTILSLLAEDHAPVALRPSILLAVDWPTVAEEAPATGDDASAAAIAHLRIQGIVADNHRATAPLAARLATVAAALASSGDKAMATHATALWGAAAALVGLPTTAPPAEWAELIQGLSALTGARPLPSHTGVMLDAVKRWHHVAHENATARDLLLQLADKAVDTFPYGYRADTSTPASQATLIGTALDRVRDMKPTLDKALADIHALRDILGVPDGGNLVDHASAFAERHMRRCDEADIEAGRMNEENTKLKSENSRLRAQVDPEAWRKAMREWTANGNKPCAAK